MMKTKTVNNYAITTLMTHVHLKKGLTLDNNVFLSGDLTAACYINKITRLLCIIERGRTVHQNTKGKNDHNWTKYGKEAASTHEELNGLW